MWIGIEESTDRRAPDPWTVRFSTEAAARRWLREPRQTLVDRTAADPSLPVPRQNFHHRLRTVYRMPRGWRLAKREVDALLAHDHRLLTGEARARMIRRHAEEVLDP